MVAPGRDDGTAAAGGVNTSSIVAVQNSGAQIAVAGSATYSAPDVAQAVSALRNAIR